MIFRCFDPNASNIIWYVDNISVQNPEVQARGITTTINYTRHESNLTITATIGNSNVRIECLTSSDGIFNFSVSEAVFHVQGQLSSSTDIYMLMFVHNFQLAKL